MRSKKERGLEEGRRPCAQGKGWKCLLAQALGVLGDGGAVQSALISEATKYRSRVF
jgi:hypothetical protein